MSIKSGSIDKGIYIIYKNEPHLVVDREFINPGKGSSFTRLKLRNAKTGAVFKDVIVKASETVEEANISEKKVQYLYFEGNSYFFMDNENYEQYEVVETGFEEKKPYLQDGEIVSLVFWEEDVIDIVLPKKKIMTVKDAPEAAKGDTATTVTKLVLCTTGLEVRTPAFIKDGDKILVNTETGEYLERVNDK